MMLAGSVASQMRIPRRPGPCLVFSIRLGSSYLPLGAVAVVEVIGEDAPVIRIHLPSFLLNATWSCEPLNAACFTSFGVRIADVDHVAVLQDEAARADRHHLQLVAALLPELEHSEHPHVLRVAVAVEIVEASLVRVRMLVCKGAAGQGGERERGDADADANKGAALESDHGILL